MSVVEYSLQGIRQRRKNTYTPLHPAAGGLMLDYRKAMGHGGPFLLLSGLP
jgi:hypothetical protein